MGTAPSQRHDHERLEQQLLQEVLAAARAYRSATAEYTKVRNEYGNMLDCVDGSHAVHNAAKQERVARENYARALMAFNEFVVHGCSPGSPGR